MTKQIIRTGTDNWVGSAKPSATHGRDNRLMVQSGAAFAYLYFPLGQEMRGTTVLNATLYLYGQNAGWGSSTLTVKRVVQRWPSPLTWDNRPDVTGVDAGTLTQTNPDDPTEWAVDITPLVQMFASGERWFGVRVATDSATARQFNSLQAAANKPRLEVRYTAAPLAPYDLSPDGGRVVSTGQPTLRWTHTDDAGDTTLAAVRVQMNSTDVWTAPTFDSGRVISTVPQYDLTLPAATRNITGGTRTSGSPNISSASANFTAADVGVLVSGTGIPAGTTIASVTSSTAAVMSAAATATLSGTATFTVGRPAYTGLAEGQKTFWRARQQDGDGLWSKWSEAASFSREAKGTLVITTPGATVAEWTPPIAWTASKPQERWQVLITSATDHTLIYHDTGQKTGTTSSYTLPPKVIRDGRDYRLVVRSWDTTDREGTPGDRSFVQASLTFRYEDDPTPNPVDNLVATPFGITPYVDLTWTRATTPDTWTILRDRKVVATDIPGAELLMSGTTYAYRDKEAPPGEHSWQVKPTVNGVTTNSDLVVAESNIKGIWLLGENGTDVLITGQDEGSWEMGDSGTTFDLPGTGDQVRVSQEVGGWRGSLSGTLVDAGGRDAVVWRNRMLSLKRDSDTEVIIYAATEAFAARIFNIVVSPTPSPVAEWNVSFDFIQTGDIEWDDDPDEDDTEPDEPPDEGPGETPDPDPQNAPTPTVTQPFRLVSANIMNNPEMAQEKVVEDVKKVKGLGTIILWQEIKPDRYVHAIHQNLPKSEWTHLFTPDRDIPISLKSKYWEVLAQRSYRAHDGKANTSPARYTVVALVRLKGTTLQFLVTNAHFVSGAWNDKAKSNKAWRREKWNQHYNQHQAIVLDARNKGLSVIGGGDWNKVNVPLFHANQVMDSDGNIIYLYHLHATGGATFVRNKKQSIGLNSDHNARVVELKGTVGSNAQITNYNWTG